MLKLSPLSSNSMARSFIEMAVCNGNDFGKKEPSDLPDKNFSSLSGVMEAASGNIVLIDFTFLSAVKAAFRLILSKPKKETLPLASLPPSPALLRFKSPILIPTASKYLLIALVMASFSPSVAFLSVPVVKPVLKGPLVCAIAVIPICIHSKMNKSCLMCFIVFKISGVVIRFLIIPHGGCRSIYRTIKINLYTFNPDKFWRLVHFFKP